MKEDQVMPVEVFAGSPWEASLVMSMLGDAGIDAYLQDEALGVIAPWYAAPGGAFAVKVVVSSADLEAALTVVRDFRAGVDGGQQV